MKIRILTPVFFLFLLLTILFPGCENDINSLPQNIEQTVNTVLLISHTPIIDSQPEGQAVSVTAEINSESELGSVFLWYRTIGSFAFSSVNMTNGGGGNIYSGNIPGSSVTSTGVEYYIISTDNRSPVTLKASYPIGAPETSVNEFTVDSNIPPVAEAGPDAFQDNGPDEETYFDGSGSFDPDGSIVSWMWNFGDAAATSSEQNPRHTYISAGIYTVTLTVTDDEGLSDMDSAIATVINETDTLGPWVYHSEVSDGQHTDQPVTISAEVRDPSDVSSVALFYQTIGSDSPEFVVMTNIEQDFYSADIPEAAISEPGIEYWIASADSAEPVYNNSMSPKGAPDSAVYDFRAFDDYDAPTIIHTEFTDEKAAGIVVSIQANIEDISNVAGATLYIKPNNGSYFSSVPMLNVTSDTWTADIPAFLSTPPGVDYFIKAYDDLSIPNISTAPASAPDDLYNYIVVSP